eukprot:349745-Chlamydomonas_euryale.AAC.2
MAGRGGEFRRMVSPHAAHRSTRGVCSWMNVEQQPFSAAACLTAVSNVPSVPYRVPLCHGATCVPQNADDDIGRLPPRTALNVGARRTATAHCVYQCHPLACTTFQPAPPPPPPPPPQALTVKYGTDFDGAAADACAEEAAVLITEGELPIATLSLRLLVALLLRRPALAAAVADRALAPAIALLGSALLQGSALEALKVWGGEVWDVWRCGSSASACSGRR